MSLENQNPLDALEEAVDEPPEESEYDQQLAQIAGEDARSVWRGELTREEFFEAYHEAFREEFGDDYVPPEGFDDE